MSDNFEKSVKTAKVLLKNLSNKICQEEHDSLEFLINYTELTWVLMYRAVVLKSDSSQTLSSIKCTNCSETYWVNCGNLSDVTAYEPDCYRCPHCGHVDIITDKIMQEINPIDPSDAEDGFKTPNEAIGLLT